MSQPYIGEIRMFGGSFAPAGWAFCNGAIVSIAENETLFNLIGTTYGGDGQETFALPNLQGRFPVHQGTGAGLSTYQIGETRGTETVTLTTNQLPAHTHVPIANGTTGETPLPDGKTWGTWTDGLQYTDVFPNEPMHAQTVFPVGGSQPHENVPPYQCVSFIISLYGIFPSQS